MSEHDRDKLIEAVAHQLIHNNELLRKLMTALDSLTAAINAATTSATALTGAVDTAVTELGHTGPTDAQLGALTGTVTALQATLDAQTVRLASATAPTPVPPPTITPAA